jgi:ribosome-binding protein aMBF1 (putative translation factor)
MAPDSARLFPIHPAEKLSEKFAYVLRDVFEGGKIATQATERATMAKKTERETKLDLIRETFAANVRLLRERKGWTQGELAERVGMHRVTISRLEAANNEPLFADACLIADTLGVTIGEMRFKLG